MRQFFIALDQTANTLVWIKGDGFGMADETLSARAYRLQSSWMRFIDGMFFWQEEHCKQAFYAELYGTQLPDIYRSKLKECLENEANKTLPFN